MTKQDIILLLTANFYEGFAEQCGNMIIVQKGADSLFELMSDLITFSYAVKNKTEIENHFQYLVVIRKENLTRLEFRAAYVLDFIYFSDNKIFNGYYQEFFSLFPLVTNESTKRHFSRIMSDILKNDKYIPESKYYEAIAAACVDWIINERVRVAVQVWAVECLIHLKDRVEWVSDILFDILDKLSVNPSPGMIVSLRRWRAAV